MKQRKPMLAIILTSLLVLISPCPAHGWQGSPVATGKQNSVDSIFDEDLLPIEVYVRPESIVSGFHSLTAEDQKQMTKLWEAWIDRSRTISYIAGSGSLRAVLPAPYSHPGSSSSNIDECREQLQLLGRIVQAESGQFIATYFRYKELLSSLRKSAAPSTFVLSRDVFFARHSVSDPLAKAKSDFAQVQMLLVEKCGIQAFRHFQQVNWPELYGMSSIGDGIPPGFIGPVSSRPWHLGICEHDTFSAEQRLRILKRQYYSAFDPDWISDRSLMCKFRCSVSADGRVVATAVNPPPMTDADQFYLEQAIFEAMPVNGDVTRYEDRPYEITLAPELGLPDKIGTFPELLSRPAEHAARLHLIPSSIPRYYPEAVTLSEISDPGNIVTLPYDRLKHHRVSDFRRDWQDFILVHSKASRSEILQQAKILRQRYSDIFEH